MSSNFFTIVANYTVKKIAKIAYIFLKQTKESAYRLTLKSYKYTQSITNTKNIMKFDLTIRYYLVR